MRKKADRLNSTTKVSETPSGGTNNETPGDEAEWDPTVPHSGDRLFWCHKTQQCLGPDGKLLDDYECNPARPCNKPF